MLVLQRRLFEQTIITVPPSDKPTQIVVEVVHQTDSKTRLGFEAPPQVKILRDNVGERNK